MNKSKSVFVTGLCSFMLGLIIAGMYKLLIVGFWIIVGALALNGFARCAVDFCGWLCRKPKESKAEPLDPVVFGNPMDEFSSTYDEIAAEVRGGK